MSKIFSDYKSENQNLYLAQNNSELDQMKDKSNWEQTKLQISKIIKEIGDEIRSMTIYEDYVIEKVRNGSSIKGLYPLTDENEKKIYEKWLKSNFEEN